MTVLRQLEAARVYAPPCLLSKFASQNSDPFLCAGNRKPETGIPETALGPLALLHRKRKWWRHCTWKCLILRQNRNRIWNRGRFSPNWTGNGNGGATCTWKYQIWRQNRNRIWNRGRSSPIEPETEMVAPLDQLYHVTGNRIEGALLPNIRSWVDLYCSWSFDIFVTA